MGCFVEFCDVWLDVRNDVPFAMPKVGLSPCFRRACTYGADRSILLFLMGSDMAGDVEMVG